MDSGLFLLGECVITPRARDVLASIDVDTNELIRRHHTGDWADMDQHDQAANRVALNNNARVFSMFRLADKHRVYVITEGDRSVTTILLPSEYWIVALDFVFIAWFILRCTTRRDL